MSKHSDLANKIFRTVVLSGAMLGPVVAGAQTPPAKNPPAQTAPAPKKEAPVKADTWASVNKELESNHVKLDGAVGTYIAAVKAKKNVDTSLTKVTDLRTVRATLDERIGKTTRPELKNPDAAPNVEKAETTWAEADKKLMASIDAVGAAKEDPAVKAAVADLEKAKKARTTAWAKVKAERTKANRRPRSPEDERPTGRGFVLA